jgi:hypothetical protein
MSDNTPSAPAPVEGVVFRRSTVKMVGLIALNVLLFLLGLWLIWAKVMGRVLFADQEVTWWGLLIGIGVVLLAPVWVALLLRSWWVRRRLVVGADRLQVVEYLRGRDIVVLQIPYANLAEFKYEAPDEWGRRIGIDLRRLDDPETYSRRGDFAINQGSEGRHYSIGGGYRGGLRKIAAEIRRAYDQWDGK